MEPFVSRGHPQGAWPVIGRVADHAALYLHPSATTRKTNGDFSPVLLDWNPG